MAGAQESQFLKHFPDELGNHSFKVSDDTTFAEVTERSLGFDSHLLKGQTYRLQERPALSGLVQLKA